MQPRLGHSELDDEMEERLRHAMLQMEGKVCVSTT